MNLKKPEIGWETVRYQVTIPQEVRDIMKIKEGQTIMFIQEKGKIILLTSV